MKCWSCGLPREDSERLRCAKCDKSEAPMKAPGIVGDVKQHFNAHFDVTQGKYFSSLEEKKAWLAKKDKTQVEGDLSPRTSGRGRFLCTKEQSRKFLAGRNLKKLIKNEELQPKKRGRVSVQY